MFRAFALPIKAERSRNKERLEASLAGLCELELLKQRQECLVLSALCLGDSGTVHGRPAWGDLRTIRCTTETPNGGVSDDFGLRRQPSSLQCTPWGIMASLEQQVAELKINRADAKPRTSASGDSADVPLTPEEMLVANQEGPTGSSVPQSSSAPCISTEGYKRPGQTEKTCHLETRGAESVEDHLVELEIGEPTEEAYEEAQRVETYISGLIQRRTAPPRPSKPRTNLAHDPRAVIVVRQNSLCRKEDQHLPVLGSIQGHMPGLLNSSTSQEVVPPQAHRGVDQECHPGAGFTEDPPHPYNQLQPSTHHKPGLYPRTRQHALANTPRSISLDYQACKVLQAQPNTVSGEADSMPKHFSNYPSSLPLQPPHSFSPPEEQLVNAEYIPAQPCRTSTQASAHHHSNPLKAWNSDGHPEQQPAAHQIQHSRAKAGPRKCRQNDDRGGAPRKPGKKACRSQSENSLQRVPERKYNTVERDGSGGGGGSGSGSGKGGSRSSQSRGKKSQHGSGGYRRWRSTLELSQDEAEQPPTQVPMQQPSASGQKDARRARKSRPTHVSYSHAHPHPHHHRQSPVHHHQLVEYQLERDRSLLCRPDQSYSHPGHGESESSTSEADSPDSSSLSSDSDESGGLVWPQQLPPQLSLPSPPVPSGAPLQPKAFVKIKASHALKKKILRFRTGSLKVMTTV